MARRQNPLRVRRRRLYTRDEEQLDLRALQIRVLEMEIKMSSEVQRNKTRTCKVQSVAYLCRKRRETHQERAGVCNRLGTSVERIAYLAHASDTRANAFDCNSVGYGIGIGLVKVIENHLNRKHFLKCHAIFLTFYFLIHFLFLIFAGILI